MFNESIEDKIEYIWNTYGVAIIVSIILIGLIVLTSSFLYQNKNSHIEKTGETFFKIISPESTIGINIKKDKLQNIIADKKTNYRYFAALYLGDIYYNVDNDDQKAIELYNTIIKNKKAPKIIQCFAAQRLGYIYLSANKTKSAMESIKTLKDNSFIMSAKQLDVFYNIIQKKYDNVLNIIDEIQSNDVPISVKEMNNELLNMISDRINTVDQKTP